METAYLYGWAGISPKEVASLPQTAALNEVQRSFAYDLGRVRAIDEDTKKSTKLKSLVENSRKKSNGKKGRVILEGVDSRGRLSERQKASKGFCETAAKILGVNIHLYESDVLDGARGYTKQDGNRITDNGFYDPQTGDIWLDINAGTDGSGLAVFTLAHELAHFVRQWSPEKFRVLSDFLMETYGKKGVSVEDLVSAQQSYAKEQGRELTFREAWEEVVADSMEMLLNDGRVMERVAALKKRDGTLADKLIGYIRRFVDRVKKAYEGITADSAEGKTVAGWAKEEIEGLQDRLADALYDASETFKKTDVSQMETSEGVKNQAREKSISRDYSYRTLVGKPDMAVTILNGMVPANRADVILYAKKNAAAVGNTDKNGSVSVYVEDIDADILLGTDGLKHGLRRTKDPQNDANYLVTMKAGEILKNSIRINELIPAKDQATGSYVLIGAAKNTGGDLYIVRSIVNRFSHELTSMDVLYAINAKIESAATQSPRSAAEPLSVTDSTISIAQLLDYVNRNFPDILPEAVLRHFGHTERPEGKIGESALFSARREGTSARRLLEGIDERAVTDRDVLSELRAYKEASAALDAAETRYTTLKHRTKATDPAEAQTQQEELKRAKEEINGLKEDLYRMELGKALTDILYDAKQEAAKKAKATADKRVQEAEDRRDRTVMRDKIKKKVNELNRLLVKPTKEKHIPNWLQRPAVELLSAINSENDHWMKKFGYTMDDFRTDVDKMLHPERIPEVGDTVPFVGIRQYANASKILGKKATPCEAKILQIYRLGSARHPYLVKGSGVYGWVDEEDIFKR